MPVWSPGFYRIEDYAAKVKELVAKTPEGKELAIEHPKSNRWHIPTDGKARIELDYALTCDGHSVTTNWVDGTMGIFNGGAAFITLAEKDVKRPHVVAIELPAGWKGSISSLQARPNQKDTYVAPDFETLVDSPIVAGNLSIHSVNVEGSEHIWADFGAIAPDWDGKLMAENAGKIAKANYDLWGGLPFKKYVFLNAFRSGGGGLEHLNSTLITATPARPANATAPAGRGGGGRTSSPNDFRYLSFVSHEYFHAFNVKRLRPVELGPFDYENPPSTTSLWISEGLTNYYGDLNVVRAGLANERQWLNATSAHIRSMQNGKGHTKQTLNDSSLDVWKQSTSGIGGNPATTVSYYEKGDVVGFLLDAHIRRLTENKKSLDDLMRLAMKRYGGAHGFTPEQWVETASEVAGTDLKGWFHKALETTEELDYTEALNFYGLEFKDGGTPQTAWTLEVKGDANEAQKGRLKSVISGGK
jgi:predicted metalloprotease with PDZ domain